MVIWFICVLTCVTVISKGCTLFPLKISWFLYLSKKDNILKTIYPGNFIFKNIIFRPKNIIFSLHTCSQQIQTRAYRYYCKICKGYLLNFNILFKLTVIHAQSMSIYLFCSQRLHFLTIGLLLREKTPFFYILFPANFPTKPSSQYVWSIYAWIQTFFFWGEGFGTIDPLYIDPHLDSLPAGERELFLQLCRL